MSDPTIPLGTRRVPAVKGEPKVVRFELSLRSMLIVMSLIGGVWLLLHTFAALLVLLAALVLVGALHPYVTWLEQRQSGGHSPCASYSESVSSSPSRW